MTALASDLVGLGVAGPLARYLGLSAPTTVVAAGTTAAGATAINPQLTFVIADTATSQTGLSLPADAPIGRPIWITNPDSDTAVIYPSSGASLNGGTVTTAGQNLAQNKTAIYIRQTTAKWLSILTA